MPEGYDSWGYLNHLCDEGFAMRYPNDDGTLRARLDYELGTIKSMGYVDYFLIVWDFINFAKSHGIAVGPGRGSAAGSIVAYCLKITDIDPIRYQLLFERFRTERVSMPDIDVVSATSAVRKLSTTLWKKYGKDQVADRYLRYVGGPRRDPRCGARHGPALQPLRPGIEDGPGGIKYHVGPGTQEKPGIKGAI